MKGVNVLPDCQNHSLWLKISFWLILWNKVFSQLKLHNHVPGAKLALSMFYLIVKITVYGEGVASEDHRGRCQPWYVDTEHWKNMKSEKMGILNVHVNTEHWKEEGIEIDGCNRKDLIYQASALKKDEIIIGCIHCISLIQEDWALRREWKIFFTEKLIKNCLLLCYC